MNYTQLTAEIQSFTQNTEADFVSSIPTFVRTAEQRIYNTVQLPVQRQNSLSATASGVQYLTMPPDFLSVFSLALVKPTGGYEYLLNKDVNFIREGFPFPGVVGQPRYYAIFDVDSLLLGPTPDAIYTLELHYNRYPASIVDAGTSWLGDNLDSALLYGSLVEAYIFMKGEADVLAMYQAKYDDALMKLKRLGDGLLRQDAYRSGQVRVPVA